MEINFKVNTFAEIILVERFKKVSYYTVSVNEETSLYRKFVSKHTSENYVKLKHIMSWLEVIGNKIGAYDHYFRNEAESGDAKALPPEGKDREPVYIEYSEVTGKEENTPNDLRLYCFRANESVVFLFNGDIKTKSTAQECKNVSAHFKLANKLSVLIDQAFRDNNIRWTDDYTDIEVDDDYLLAWD